MPKRPLRRASELTREFQEDAEYAVLYHEVANEEIGAALRAVREARGLSQREVAERMDVTRARVSQIESVEGTSLALEVLNRYAQAVGCRLDLSLQELETTEVVGKLYVTTSPRSEFTSIPAQPYEANKASDEVPQDEFDKNLHFWPLAA